MAQLDTYKRTDGRWAWRLKADNGQIIATDGGQGYQNEKDAQQMADNIINGVYTNAKRNVHKGLTVEDLLRALQGQG